MSKPSLELKGASFTLSVLHINSSDLQAVMTELDSKLAQAPQFFLGAPLVVNLSAIQHDSLNLSALKDLLISRQLVIVGITGATTVLSKQAKDLGLAIVKAGKQSSTPPPAPRQTKIVKQNIRSGQQVYAKNGDLIIFGAVGNGAEVIADGSIHIYGALRGKAMAGAAGDTSAVIIAHSLEAELVSIAGQYWLAENLQQHSSDKSGCIRLDGESLMVESLPL
ncbi:septum site-determining protein MinC [Shewanella sp. SP2S2-4]|jgi:septum site-determining protein MinC|uniref:Probable septum site-determining protein MinC n=5 Tax=Shewanella TaxID=22 RepID=MINC_SHEB2|nr:MULTISPECIES: septum site-determining protein MinC [Shewanella]A3D3R1.1 RecName: Full=Probable septum site-determining protein MinC [Shewanella baltica OS155]A6WMJ9.1 RecName: Full=Probable septum site-determining protein MinC [Shewanella baltica OS185]A9KYY5.1 RecName: Full=Probable septum site-determining protein MinC [Shewanella baltica OS195]B8E7G0.1 RecName: Full=Probable septum site-determining protein MinC [Shewanella baltica OS223]ABN61374.1 septum site-determining protein MinC [She